MVFPGITGFGVPAFVTAKAIAETPGCPLVAPYGSLASVVQPGIPPLTLTAPGDDEVKITPPPPPAPGPCRFPGKAPGACSGQVTPPFPPTALAVNPVKPPVFANTSTVPPPPPPPPPSFSVSRAAWPFDVIAPVPTTEPV